MRKSVRRSIQVCSINRSTRLDALSPRSGLPRQAALVYLEIERCYETHVSGYAVACAEGYEVARNELVCEEVELFAVAVGNGMSLAKYRMIRKSDRVR